MHRHNGTDYQHANDCPHCWREASDIQSEVIERLSTKLAAEREAREKANHDLTEREHEIERLTRERATEAWRAEKAERERNEARAELARVLGLVRRVLTRTPHSMCCDADAWALLESAVLAGQATQG